MPNYSIVETNQARDIFIRFQFFEPGRTEEIDITGATGTFVLKRELSADDEDAMFLTTSINIPNGTDGIAEVRIPATTMTTFQITDSWDLYAQLKLRLTSAYDIASDVIIVRITEDA